MNITIEKVRGRLIQCIVKKIKTLEMVSLVRDDYCSARKVAYHFCTTQPSSKIDIGWPEYFILEVRSTIIFCAQNNYIQLDGSSQKKQLRCIFSITVLTPQHTF